MKNIIFLFGFVMIISGCTINKAITYPTADIPINPDKSLKNIILSVEDFTDGRKEHEHNLILFNNKRDCEIDEKRLCINAERHYKTEPVAKQLSIRLLHHFKKRFSFKKVVANTVDKSTIDYYITGKVSSFYGVQEFSMTAKAGTYFGLIGVLATMNIHTPGKIIVEITDLKIYDKHGQVVKDMGTFSRHYEGDFLVDAECFKIYEHINAKLKEYYTELTELIENELKLIVN